MKGDIAEDGETLLRQSQVKYREFQEAGQKTVRRNRDRGPQEAPSDIIDSEH